MIRVPVVNPDGTPAMPCKASRARRLVRDDKAIGKRNKLGIYYIQLLEEPSGRETQPIVAGNDPGKHYSGIGLQSSKFTLFVDYLPFENSGGRGHCWQGQVTITDAPFFVIRRPPISRRQLHLMLPSKGGKRRKYGGTITRHSFRKGDYVEAEKAGIKYQGWCSGDTATQVSVSSASWSRIGQFTATKVKLIQRSIGLICTQENDFCVEA